MMSLTNNFRKRFDSFAWVWSSHFLDGDLDDEDIIVVIWNLRRFYNEEPKRKMEV